MKIRDQWTPAFLDQCHRCRLIDAIHDAVVVVERDGRIELWNSAATAITGLLPAETIGRTLGELGLEFVDEAFVPVSHNSFAGRQRVKDSVIGLRRPYGLLWLSLTIEPVLGDDGHDLSGFVLVLHDITELKRTDEALRESEEKFRTVAEALSAAFGIVCGTRFVYANTYFAQLSGYTIEELLTKDFPDLVHPDFQPMMLERALRRQRGEPVPSRYEFKMVRKNGEARWVDFSVARTVFRGQPAIIGTGFDITDRKNAEATVRESEAKLKAFCDNAPLLMGVIEVLPDDSDTIHLYDNPEVCRFFGLPPGATTNRRATELNVPQQAIRSWIQRYRESERLKEPVHFEYQDFRAGGASWGEVTVVYIGKGEAGRSKFIYMAADITKKKRDEADLREAKAAAERANTAKDQFLAVLSHELRTPLTPVLGGVSLMERRQDLAPEFRQVLEMIRRNVTLEARLIDDLLDLTRIARGKIALDRKEMDVSEAIERAIQVCRGDLDSRRLRFEVELPHSPLWVNGDTARLQQVFWNLLKNAVKFTPDGGYVGLKAYRSKGEVVVEVKDSGIGIAEEDLGRIFNAFEQGNGRKARQFGGLGLGLAISQRLVEMHRGRITAYSEGKGTGALFRVMLPEAKEPLKAEEHHGQARPNEGAGKRVLLVEDHGDTARMMQALLESYGYQVDTAADVSQALGAIERNKFDLLISDLGLPDRSGLELMEELRQGGAAVKGIALSGFGREEDIEKSKAAGFTEHVIKPVDIDVLIGAVERVLETNESL